MRTPPGWYPDPGHTGAGPVLERWWDGERWTEHTRASAAPAPPAGPPGFEPSKGPLIAGVIGGLAVVAALVVSAILVAGPGDEDGNQARDTPSPTASREGGDGGSGRSGSPSPAPDAEPLTPARGVSLPLLTGWTPSPGFHGASVNGRPYNCPGDKSKQCVRAGAVILNGPGPGNAESVAKADISANARQSYSADLYGGILSHEEIRSEEVDVAGQDGYRVRWKIDNKVDPDAYVESVAFPHPDGSGRLLLLRSGFDIHHEAPPLGHMDRLVEGIEQGEVSDDGSSEQVRLRG